MKRLFDIVVSILGLIVLLPIICVIGVVIFLQLGNPVLFRQKRPGFGGEVFEIIKFRSMHNAVDSEGKLLSDSERLTSFGKFLRSTSLDELPGLWNVLKGDMSLVGPRPLLIEYLPLYNDVQRRRHNVRPGVTGWAQVNGRNALSWQEKFELDVWYVENQSFWLDIKILLLTVIKVIDREGISSRNHETMEKFTGNG